MGNILTSILQSASAMRAFSQGLNVTQTNVSNESTPGYAKQIQSFQTDIFDLSQGFPGGVHAAALIDTRDEFAERSVRSQQQSAGNANQRASDLGQIAPIFDVSANAGISGALSGFFQSFSALSITPNSNPSRQAVLTKAGDVAQAFNQTAAGLTNARSTADRDISSVVARTNRIAGQIRDLNVQVRQNSAIAKDPGFDAQLHNALEDLSQSVDFTALTQADGTTTILIGGQTAAVVGDHTFPISAGFDNIKATIRSSDGRDITAQLGGGTLSGVLATRNTSIPSYLADLNRLAATFADQVNAALNNGVDANGNSPSVPLFSYDSANGEAQTLTAGNLATSDLAAASAGAPGGNGNALALAQIGSAKTVDGFTFTEFYGSLGGRVGGDLASARNDVDVHSSLLNQAKTFRAQSSGVSLDEEAARLLEFQKSYEAAAKMVGVLNTLADTVLGLMNKA